MKKYRCVLSATRQDAKQLREENKTLTEALKESQSENTLKSSGI